MTTLSIIERQVLDSLLTKLGNPAPTQKQFNFAKKILFRTTLSRELLFDGRLSAEEITCLLLATRGFSSRETANFLDVKLSTINSRYKEIKLKLKCRTLIQALYEGLCFGYIAPLNRAPLNKGD